MDFRSKKLPKLAAENLRMCSINSVQAYALMYSPTYVYLKRNEKFVSVKGPLDFFTEEDLERLSGYEMFFFPETIDLILPFKNTGAGIRTLLSWEPISSAGIQLAPPPYVISDTVLRKLAPIWGKENAIDPFFVAALVGEICEAISPEILKSAREKDILSFEHALLKSGWAVFLALHLGYCDLKFLNFVRLRFFQAFIDNVALGMDTPEISELMGLTQSTYGSHLISNEIFFSRLENGERQKQKLESRTARIKSGLNPGLLDSPSVWRAQTDV